ncbi:MAG: 3-keto-5-aminohexanoate cleavage protein [Bosea sp. (in: a-proteobacteria)]|uniref:3-keto-5-aminohexanoate cleavage protein n=1 Tax=Bosea sp. (in: a-proteobacteria) TaxID=1871050 RepID=UPI003F7BD9E6
MASASDQPVIICCAVTGSGNTIKKNPAVPVTPRQIAESAIAAVQAGAAIVHLHVRDPQSGAPSMEASLYHETVEIVRASGVDVIINLTTGAGARFVPDQEDPSRAGPGTTFTTPARRVEHVLALKPEVCSLDIGSMNMGAHAFINTPEHLAEMAMAVTGAGVVPELEVFEAGHVMLARAMIERGQLPMPPLFQICLGVSWAQPATSEAMLYMKSLLPPAANWFAFGVGSQQFPMAAQAILLGGHVRVGLEDNLYLSKGALAPSNAALVEKAVDIIHALGRPVATASEARSILSMGEERLSLSARGV